MIERLLMQDAGLVVAGDAERVAEMAIEITTTERDVVAVSEPKRRGRAERM